MSWWYWRMNYFSKWCGYRFLIQIKADVILIDVGLAYHAFLIRISNSQIITCFLAFPTYTGTIVLWYGKRVDSFCRLTGVRPSIVIGVSPSSLKALLKLYILRHSTSVFHAPGLDMVTLALTITLGFPVVPFLVVISTTPLAPCEP